MSNPNVDPQPALLDYAQSTAGSGNLVLSIIVGLLGVAVGFSGAMLTFIGLAGVVLTFQRSTRHDFAGDLFETSLCSLIGGVALIVGIRWCMAVRRIAAGRPTKSRRS